MADQQEHIDNEVAGDRVHPRDRLLAALTLIAGVGLLLGLPFALRAGFEFFMPLTAAIVIAIALVPVLEWLERRRVPAPLAAFLCVAGFLAAANAVLVAIIVPAAQFFRLLPERIGRIQANLKPLLDLYDSFARYVDKAAMKLAQGSAQSMASAAQAQVQAQPVPPSSLIDLIAVSAPSVFIHIFFGALIVFFFLAGWTRLRRQTITSRASFDGAMATARVIQDVVDDTSSYLGTISVINLALGLVIVLCLWLMGMPYPLMWGGIVALLNYVPYFGPIGAVGLLALGGLMTFTDLWVALVPAVIMIGAHLLEANVITPLIVGRRLTINPIMILISLSFWGWVWGTAGALLAVPILIIAQTVVAAAGQPDIAGFLFEHGTLGQLRRRSERGGQRGSGPGNDGG
ncbi:AI-2E family transporter [Sphingomonas sp.]|uniref:AI-2E family transporter n=1 Tax=Sphingomonas sp. TaxID=28214 RepID=UPI0025ED0F3F|nr:AI-2E family transporter [Sphingomonas sp.]